MPFDIEGARKAGYSDAEIADHLAGTANFDAGAARKAGYSDADLIDHLSAMPAAPSNNLARNAAAGAVEGGTSLLNAATDPFGSVIGPTVARVGGTLYDAGAHLFGYPPMSEQFRNMLYDQDKSSVPPAASQAVNALDQALPGPKLADVQANTLGEQLLRKATGAAVAGGAGGAGSALAAVGGALTGDAAGRVAPDWLAPGAELAGNVAGASVAGRLATPVRSVTSPERQRLVGVAQSEDIPLTAGEQTGSKPLMKTEQMLGQTPGSAGQIASDIDRQQRAVNSAVASRAGLNSDTLTSDVLNRHLDDLGSQIGTLASNNTMQLPAAFIQQLGDLRQATRYMPSAAKQEIQARINQFQDMITVDPAGQNPVLRGRDYQTLQGDLRDAIRGAEGTAQQKLLGLRDMLRQQMEASMSPQDAAQWRQLNRYYANGKVIQDAMGAAGAGTAEGNISLLQLRGAINRSLGKDAYGAGYGDLNELARVGQSVLRRPPDSGSPQGILINRLLSGGSILGAMGGATASGATGAGIGAAAPFVTPLAISTLMRGRIPGTDFSPGQAYLKNQLAREVSPAAIAAILQAADAEQRRNTLMR